MANSDVAVLTGDLVRSSRQPAHAIDEAMQALRETSLGIGAWQSPPSDPRFTRFRGDGWQILLVAPWLALRAALVLQGRLIALGQESRISIGIGTIRTPGRADLADAAGVAFEVSGQGLDHMDDATRLVISGAEVLEQDALIAELLGERMGRWTAAQAEAAAMLLASPARAPTLQEIGTRLGISPQAVNDRVRGAGCQAIASVLRRWEAVKLPGHRERAP